MSWTRCDRHRAEVQYSGPSCPVCTVQDRLVAVNAEIDQRQAAAAEHQAFIDQLNAQEAAMLQGVEETLRKVDAVLARALAVLTPQKNLPENP